MPTLNEELEKIARKLQEQGGRHGSMNLLYINGGINPYTREPVVGLKEVLSTILDSNLPDIKRGKFNELVLEYCHSGRGAVGSRGQKEILKDIVTEFSQPAEKRQTVALNILTIFASRSPQAFILKDAQGDNFATGITRNDSKKCFVMHGKNSSGEPRFIHLYDDGRVTGYNNSDELGIVGSQLYHNRMNIFQHFNVDLPQCHQPIVGAQLGK
ncbi:hypothetical protein EP47_03900 [Legionella norrlandica]|uniref:Uncharacterized protein n=1 Tax=Legionella norrlandica TaxID=1498499 RepID=A0A0A2SWU3_9GAMM|nr:hypothetical protein [Legionella norrlandica]KGP64206.1 hypothetical protein EP47_03900 [Legionella norrlandica]